MNDREKTIKVWEELGADEKLPFIIREIKH